MPNLDPKIKELAAWENGCTEFPKGPIYWVPVERGKRMEARARGTVDKKERNIRVCTIPVANNAKDAPEEPVKDAEDGPLSEKAVEVESCVPNGKAEAA